MMSSKKNNNWAFLADFTPHRYDVNERSHFPTKNPKINPFVVKSLLFYHYFQEKEPGSHKKIENIVALLPKAYQSILQNPMAKKYKHF